MVTPTSAGVAVSSKAVFDRVIFNIVLESLFYNIPYPIFKLVALMAVAVLVIIFIAIPKTLKFFETLKQAEKSE